MANDIIDINVYETTETVSITVNPNLTTVNINEVVGVIPQNLQEVTNVGSTTTNSITANSFIKSGGTGTNILLDNGSTVALSSVGGNTNLTPSQTSTNFTINSDTGTDATIPLGDGTKAGATLNDYTTAEKNKLSGIATGAEVNVNADWNSVSGDSQILNKPTIPSISGLATVTYVDTQDALKVDKVAGSRLITSAESTILGNTSGTNTGDQNLQSVTTSGASTTTPITANSFVKSGGTSSQILAADGSVITQGNNITITGGVISSVGGTGGGGSSVNYYLNGSTSQGTFGGSTYYEFSKTAVIGTGADFSRSSNGYIASFITDVADPSLLLIPAGNWNLEFFFNSSPAFGSPSFYVELYKYDGTTFTLIASNSATPEGITNGTSIDAYFTALAVPETVLTVNDRLAIRVFVNASSRTITLHTQNGHLCQVITTFTSGLTALNGLQAQVQNFSTGTTGGDFAINSSGSTHTFNLPSASATDRGVVTTGIQTIAGDKTFTGTTAGITKTMVGLSNVDNTSDTNKPISTATQTALNLKQNNITLTVTGTSGAATLSGATLNIPQYSGATDLTTSQTSTNFTINSSTGTDAVVPLGNGTSAGATSNDYTSTEKTKLGKYPSTATNGKILQGNGTSYVEIATPTGTTNLGYTASTTDGTVTSSTGTSATIPLANGTNAGLLTAAEKTKLTNTSGTNSGDETTATIKTKLGITTLSGSNTGDETTATIKTKLGITTLSGSNTGDQDLSTLAPKASPTFTGTVVLPSTTSIGTVTSTEIGYLDNVTSAIQTQLDNKIAKQAVGTTYTTNAIATVSVLEYSAIVTKDANTLYFII